VAFAISCAEARAYCRTVQYINERGELVDVDKRHCCAVMQTYGYKLSADKASRIAAASASTFFCFNFSPTGTSLLSA
jgi:hypothetical protein